MFDKTNKYSLLENVQIHYAGAFLGEDFGAGVKVFQSNVLFKNVVFSENANNALWLINSSSIVDSCHFIDNLSAKGIYIQGGVPEIKNSVFSKNNYGIYLDSWYNDEIEENVLGEPILMENIFSHNISDDFYDAQ